MSKSLYDFSNEKIVTKSPKESQSCQLPPNLEQSAKKYAGKSKKELMDIFQEQVAKQKANGTFDINKLESSIESLGNLLSSEQKKNIKELLNQIR